MVKDYEESVVVTYAKGLRLFTWVVYGWEGEWDQFFAEQATLKVNNLKSNKYSFLLLWAP